jgi:hypothetical protein
LKIPNILEVLYAPHKAFKKLGEKPNYVGPVIIIAVLVVANLSFAYMALSKTYLETSVPNGQNKDEWTQNSTQWTSNALVSLSNDSITGAYYGNASIAFSAVDTTSVWMQLGNIGSVNCSSQGGFNQLSFRLKQSTQEKPQNVSLYLNTTNTANYFYHDLTLEYSNSSVDTWYNATVPLVSGWTVSNSNANWSDISGLRLEFSWNGNSNASLLVDGLFFHGIYQSWLDQVGTGYMLSFALTSVMQFVITWVIFSGLLFLIGRTFGGKVVWRLILVAVGLILITLVVQALINVASYATLSQLNYPFALVGGVQGEGTEAYNMILDQTANVRMITSIAQFVIWAWTIALGAVLLRFTAELAWLRSILAAVAAYIVTLLVSSFLFG